MTEWIMDYFSTLDVVSVLVIFSVTAVASAVNSVAGGGTILTFPMLNAILPETPSRMIIANATSTVGLWPGAMAAAWAYKGERVHQPSWANWLFIPSAAGAVVGSILVLRLPDKWFATFVPWLILFSAILFTLHPWITNVVKSKEPLSAQNKPMLIMRGCVLQFLVALYGGYFGAGIGILMLAMLSTLKLGDIHRLNAVKNVLAMIVNGAAATLFICGSLFGHSKVAWGHATVMAVGAVAGGLVGAHVAQRMPAQIVRKIVAMTGFMLAGYYFLK